MMKKLISLAVAVFLFFLLLSQFSMSFAKSNLAFFFFVPGEGEEEEDINVSGELCCPEGFIANPSTFILLQAGAAGDKDKKCYRTLTSFLGTEKYEVIDKIKCGENITGKFCCPEGYSMNGCPVQIDIKTTCCKSKWGTSLYDTAYRIECTLRTTGPIANKSYLCSGDENCLNCINGEGSWTALGCIPTKSPSSFVKYLLNFAIGIGGGIAFLLMIFGSLQIIFSGGNPDKVKTGKEIITAALGGLLLIIFSVFILRVIGVDILQIPGFGK